MLFDLPHDIFHSVTPDFVPTPSGEEPEDFSPATSRLQVQTMTWTHNTSPTCGLCNANDVQDEQHFLFNLVVAASIHTRSLSRICVSLFHPAGFDDVSAFLSQNNNMLYFFLHALEERKKERLRQQGNPCLRELRKHALEAFYEQASRTF